MMIEKNNVWWLWFVNNGLLSLMVSNSDQWWLLIMIRCSRLPIPSALLEQANAWLGQWQPAYHAVSALRGIS